MTSSGNVLYAVENGVYVLKFVGDVRLEFGTRIDALIEKVQRDLDLRSVVVDLSQAVHVDSTSLGLLAKLSQVSSSRLATVPVLICRDRGMQRFLRTMGFSDLFEIIDAPLDTQVDAPRPRCVEELPDAPGDESRTRESVLNAHRLLMTLNEHNAREFKDLVHMLEQGSSN